jgi:ATPase subunit of ABC transporter with duplicated ATPase domains
MNGSIPMTLNVDCLLFTYSDQPLFNNFSFSLPLGVSLIRSEESRGKTTLIRLLAGELTPEQGTISLKHRDLIGIDSRNETCSYREKVFFIDARTESFDQISAVQYLAHIESTYPGFDRQVIPQLIEGLGLAPHQDKPLYMLSAGSKRKVWIAAAIASQAKITLIDDLTAALDRGSIEFIVDQLIQISKQCDRHFIFSHYGTLERVPYAAIVDI